MRRRSAIPRRSVILGEVVPNIISPVMVEAGLRLTYSIAIIASLSFLGFGLQPPNGRLGADGEREPDRDPAEPLAGRRADRAIAILTVGANMFSDAVARTALGIEAPIAPPAMSGSDDALGGPSTSAATEGAGVVSAEPVCASNGS